EWLSLSAFGGRTDRPMGPDTDLPTVRPGDEGPLVSRLDNVLPVKHDEIRTTMVDNPWPEFDEYMEKRVRRFQRQHGLTENGVVDATTWRLLMAEYRAGLGRRYDPQAAVRTVTDGQRATLDQLLAGPATTPATPARPSSAAPAGAVGAVPATELA